MAQYIIQSSDPDNYGTIDSINLEPWFPTTHATIQVTSINTLANFQILTDDDYIAFNFGEGLDDVVIKAGARA
jgi:hypothetical protein